MADYSSFKALGFSQYEAACYMALLGSHPENGSQLSKASGIARSRIYDVIRGLTAKGLVIEVNAGQYAPLPPDELINRLKREFNRNLDVLKAQMDKAGQKKMTEYVWTLTGYDAVMAKAGEMIDQAESEIYVRLFPDAGKRLEKHLTAAEKRGVNIRYIAMGRIEKKFDVQVTHPNHEKLVRTIGGMSIDVITDRQQALVGVFETGNTDLSRINWTRSRSFITAGRDSLRHDFYHCFLEKVLDDDQPLTPDEQRIYKIVKHDD